MHDFSAYRHALREICFVNGLEPPTIMHHAYGDAIFHGKIATARRNKFWMRKSQSSTKLRTKKYDDVKKGRKDAAEFVWCKATDFKT